MIVSAATRWRDEQDDSANRQCCRVSHVTSSTSSQSRLSVSSSQREASTSTARLSRRRSGTLVGYAMPRVVQARRDILQLQLRMSHTRSHTPARLVAGISANGSWARTLPCDHLSLLPRSRRRVARIRHRQAPNVRKRSAMAQGAERSRGPEHCDHACRKQERFEALEGGPDGGG